MVMSVDKDKLYVPKNLSLGTTSRAAQLEIKSPSTSSMPLQILASDNSSLVTIHEDSQGGGQLRIKDPAGNLPILLNYGGASYINGGNLGIGTDKPQSKLHVTGSVTIEGEGNYLKIPVVNTDPANPQNGMIWYNSTQAAFKCRQGGVTKKFTTS